MSLGKDLASIRKSKNLTLEDVQNAIKIPVDTLNSIEDDSIFSEPNRNKTYIRSFVRSYAKLLKIDDKDIVRALDEMEAGTYSGNLFPESQESEEKQSDITAPVEEVSPKKPDPDDQPSKNIQKPAPKPETPKKTENDTPEVNSVNWADMGRRFTTAGKSSKVWLIIVLFVIIGAIGGGSYFFWDDIGALFSSSEPEMTQESLDNDQGIPIPPTTADSSDTEIPALENEPEEQAESEPETQSQQPITLGDTLTVAVYAAYGQLEPVRVTSDLNWRTNPFWMEEGESYYFDFSDTLLVRGQYSRFLLLFNGHVIENPRQNNFSPSFNSIMLTREVLDQPQYLAPPPAQFPLEVGPPDSTVYRIRF